MFKSIKEMFGGPSIGTLLKALPQSKIDETSQDINAFIAAKLQSVAVKDGETAAALIVDAGDTCMINIVVINDSLSVVEMKERFSVNEIINNIVEAMKHGEYK
jgi:hypothetical protein